MDKELLQTIERIVNSQSKLEVLYYFYRNPFTWEALGGLAQRLHRSPRDLESAIRDLVRQNLLIARAGRGAGHELVYNYSREVSEAPRIQRVMEAYEGEARRDVLQAILKHDSETRLQALARRREVDDLRTRFVAMVTHELRTPLTVLKSVLATLHSTDPDDAEQREWLLGRADSQCDRLTSLVENLLVLSGMQTGRKLELYLGEVEIPRLMAELRDRFAQHGLAHRLEFELEGAPETVVADEYLLGQLLGELIHNGVKFSPEGSIVTVSVTGQCEDVVFAVEDRGIGMSPLQREQAFEPFYQAELDASRLAGGMGIGLFMSRNIAEAHGGRLWIEDKGTPGLLVKCALPLVGPQLAD
ncbi:MAG: HAMP domain-containing sensor histidine kinase [Armatimonadia bacterium]